MLGWREAQRGHRGTQRRASSHARPEEGGLEEEEGHRPANGAGQTPPAQVLLGLDVGACGRFRKPQVA